MNILCCLDDNYVQHTSVMLTSFFINNDFEHHNIYVITNQDYLSKIRGELSDVNSKSSK